MWLRVIKVNIDLATIFYFHCENVINNNGLADIHSEEILTNGPSDERAF